ncbi:hypothetical protein GLOIN_2v1776159 [Rhizophagus clarus]|uniref:Replication origin-binding protein domain-containing protein n=1 Tax=Rhizophagus clarus TaxID=94130 RepID=A0A8H3QWP7_9GLOM|nr:hypothetical protein GLOIN_2v1776159 [Rhizophagus clarus]
MITGFISRDNSEFRITFEVVAGWRILLHQLLLGTTTSITFGLFFGLADFDFEPDYNDHVYFQYLSNNKNDISLLGAYHSEEIYLKYIIQVAGKGFTVVNHPSEVYGIPDAHKCIDGNLPFRLVLDIDARQNPNSMNPELPFLDKYKITRKDLLSRILIAYADIIYSDLKHLVPLNAFILTSSSNADKCSWHIVYPHTRFIDYRDLKGFVEKVANRVGKPYSEFINIGLYKSRFSLQLLGLAKEDRVKRPAISSVKQGYRKLENYLVQPKWDASEIWPQTFSPEKLEKDAFQLIEDETALSKGADFVTAKYKWLEVGSIKKGFINFQAKSYEACPICDIRHEKDQELSINEWDIIIVQVESLFRIEFTARSFVAILDESNAIMRQMSSGTNAQESESAMRDVLRSARYVLAMDVFANKSTLAFLKTYRSKDIHIIDNRYQPRIDETIEILYDSNSRAEAIRIGCELLKQGKRVAFVSIGAVMARALVEKASKLSELDCVAYTNTVEAGISFEVTGHFDIVIAITNIATPVHVEALAQMLYRICDSELESARPNNLLVAIKGHREWNNNTISYKVDESLAVVTFIEVKQQKRLSARYFIEKLWNRKKVCNEVRVEALVIKETDFNAVATSRNLDSEETEVLKFDQKRSIADTMALKRFYMRNLYCKDMSIENWNNICNRKFIENFSSSEAWKHFLQLSYFQRQGHDEGNAMKGLKAEENVQWEIACNKAKENLEKSVAEDLHFTGIDDKRTLSSDTASESFMRSCEKFIEIQNQTLLLFGFKSRAKKTPDLHSAIKTINAIAGNWCGYTVESDKKRIGPKGQQVRQYSYRINRQPYNGIGFGDKSAPELPPYRSKTDNEIQELFDSIGQEK